MKSKYYTDPESFSLERFSGTLTDENLLPGRKILLNKKSEYFKKLRAAGISNLKELLEKLKNRKKIESFSSETGIPLDYLTILARQAKFWKPSPVVLSRIPGTDDQVLKKLDRLGIKNTKQLFDAGCTYELRKELSKTAGIDEGKLMKLASFSDLARAGWTGPVFISLLYESGIRTIEKLAEADAAELHAETISVNDKLMLTKSAWSVNDIRLCIETARLLPVMLEV